MCKRQFSAALPETPEPWPIRCPRCNRALYPDELLQRPEPGEVMLPERAELRIWTGDRSLECTKDELRRMRKVPEKPRVEKPLAPPPAPVVAIQPAPSAALASTRRFSPGKIALVGAALTIVALLIILLLRG